MTRRTRSAPLWAKARAVMFAAGRPVIAQELFDATGCAMGDIRRWLADGLVAHGPRVPRVRSFGPLTLLTFTLTATAKQQEIEARRGPKLMAPEGRYVPSVRVQKEEGAKRAGLPTIIPAGVKTTEGPNYTHDPRHQCAPGEKPFGAGFSAIGIGRDLETGRPWQ